MNTSYSNDDIINILYKNRFQNYKVNRLLKAWENKKKDPSFELLFDGHTISCKAPSGKNSSLRSITVNLDTLSKSKKCLTFSRILHNLKGKTYQQNYHDRITQLVNLSLAFKNLSKESSISVDSPKLKKLKFQVPTIEKHPELRVSGTKTILEPSKPAIYSIINYHETECCIIPHNGLQFNSLDKLIRKLGIDKKGLNHYLINDILKLTFDLSQGLVNDKQTDLIEDLKSKIAVLRDSHSHYPYNPKDEIFNHSEIFDEIDLLLDYEQKILVEAKEKQEKLIHSIQKPYEDVLKNSLPPCAVHPKSSIFTLIFDKDIELPLDRESLTEHMLVFEDLDETMDNVDLSSFELNKEVIDLLTLYFNQGDLRDKNLHDLDERSLLHFFDRVLRLGIPRLEALLTKEIYTRVIEETWEDGSLIIARKGRQDPLQPLVDAVKH